MTDIHEDEVHDIDFVETERRHRELARRLEHEFALAVTKSPKKSMKRLQAEFKVAHKVELDQLAEWASDLAEVQARRDEQVVAAMASVGRGWDRAAERDSKLDQFLGSAAAPGAAGG